MQRLGLVSAADMLAQLPSNVGTFQLDGDGTDTSFNVGSTIANLRGMNTGLGTRTLVLVDGRRQVQTNNGGAVDLSFIPSILISRMETVTGGASAVYGSDATAGVVNVILDRNVQGLRLDASFGQNKNGDLRNYSVSLASGVNVLEGRGALTVSYEHQVTDPAASCAELFEWCAKSARSISTTVSGQLYYLDEATGEELPCNGQGQPLCGSPFPPKIIAPRSRLFPDLDLTATAFYENMRLNHEGTTNGTIHTSGPRRPANALPTATNPNPLQGESDPTAGTFWAFTDDGTDIVEWNPNLDPFWREYAWGGTTRSVVGGDGPLYTKGSPTRSGQKRDNIFANFRWEANDNVNINARLTYGVTTGESIQNAPRGLQGTYCVNLETRNQRRVATTTNLSTFPAGTTPGTIFPFDPDTLAIPGVAGEPRTNNPLYDGNPAYAGHSFFVTPGAVAGAQLPDGTPAPLLVRHLGPTLNGFLDPRAPHPVSDEMRQVLEDRSLGYGAIINPNATNTGTTTTSAGMDPTTYLTCQNVAFGFPSVTVAPAVQGINIQKNQGDWLNRRVTSDTDSLSLGFTADGPLFGSDSRWTWDASVQFGRSDREQIRYDIQRSFRFVMATDAVYDPATGTVVCRINGSEAVGGPDLRELYRNYIMGLSSYDAYYSSLGVTLPGPNGTRIPVTMNPATLQQGMEQLDLLRDGCQPLNPFGKGYVEGDAADEARQRAAIDFAYGDQSETSTSDQVTASISVSGEVWKGFGAGPVRMAAGVDYRDNSTINRNSTPGGEAPIVKSDFGTQYGDPWNGVTNNYEIFSEFELPLVRDRLGARYLSANFTGRRTLNENSQKVIPEERTTFVGGNTRQDQENSQYSSSWRASLNWNMTEWMRLRATRSVDTRSPSSRELFASITPTGGGFQPVANANTPINNPWRNPEVGGQFAQREDVFARIRGSNETLENEQSGTDSIGLVFTPGGIARGLSLSFDYQELTVKGGISYADGFFNNTGTDDEEDRIEGLNFLPYAAYRCFESNDPFWCSKVTFNPAGSADEPNVDGLDPYADCEAQQMCTARTDIVAIEDVPFNSEPFWTRNLDVSATYNFQLDGGGSLSVRLLGTHALEQSRCLQVVRTPDGRAGECLNRQNVRGVTGSGNGSAGFSNFTSQPTWSGNAYASYSKQAFAFTLQARYVGKGWQSFQGLDPGDPEFRWNMYNTVMEQELPSWTTFNLTTSYNFARSRFAPERFENLQLSLTIDNLFDKQPDFYSSTTATGGVNTRFYNGNGRTFRLNFRSAM